MTELSLEEVDEVSGAGLKDVIWIGNILVEAYNGFVAGWNAG